MTSAICGGVGKRYHVRVRERGMRRYRTVGKSTTSFRVAVRRLADAFVENHNYDRGDVLMTAEYYDPVQLCEMRR